MYSIQNTYRSKQTNPIQVKLDLDYYLKKYVAIIGAYLIIAFIIASKKGVLHHIIHAIKDPWFIGTLLVMMAYLVYGFAITEDEKFRDAVMAGFTAFIIALCAKFDLIFIPFFIIFTLKHYVPDSV